MKNKILQDSFGKRLMSLMEVEVDCQPQTSLQDMEHKMKLFRRHHKILVGKVRINSMN